MVWGIHTIAGILPFAVENYCNLNTVGKFFTFFLSCLVIPTLKFNCLVQLKKSINFLLYMRDFIKHEKIEMNMIFPCSYSTYTEIYISTHCIFFTTFCNKKVKIISNEFSHK